MDSAHEQGPIGPTSDGLEPDEEPEAMATSPGAPSSDGASLFESEEDEPDSELHTILDLPLFSDGEDEDYVHIIDQYPDPSTPEGRRARMSDDQKAREVLHVMSSFPKFSLRKFIVTVFESQDPVLKGFANIFLTNKSHLSVMDIWVAKCGAITPTKPTNPTADWIVKSAGEICAKEGSWLTDRASDGPFKTDAEFLRVSATDVTVDPVREFRLPGLLERYERTMPHLQVILKAVINKEGKVLKPGSRDPNGGRTLVTSMLLNLRSRTTNYHGIINVLVLWDNRAPKRLVQMFNHLAVTVSYPTQCRAVVSVSDDSIRLARVAANNPLKIKLFPYDNYNWLKRIFEASAQHGAIQYDEVSALLIILPTPEGPHTAQQIVDVKAFDASEGNRHKIPQHQALEEILPSMQDESEARMNSIIHAVRMLIAEIATLSHLADSPTLPSHFDKDALPLQATEEYYLPTFDQEQGSTRGNMVVLEHYLQDVLQMPKETFETTVVTVLGDRLTTARDRAAQDQRAVDRSEHRFDHLSSLAMVSGLMHYGLNYMQAIAGHFWGSKDTSDDVSLSTLRDVLPNRQDVQPRRVDYYAMLRFLDAVTRALVLRASMVLLGASTLGELEKKFEGVDANFLTTHAAQIIDSFVVQSPDRLEATGVKTVPGNSVSGNASLLFYCAMSLTEMQGAIKFGHPTRIVRTLKFWLPIFYAAGSYNYANETMELLHNLEHDWPKPYAPVARDGMLVNSLGRKEGCKPTDIRVEQLNDRIKERAHGANATPELLEKITPAMGHVSELTDRLFEDLGVERQNQKHQHVKQHRDVQLLVEHLTEKSVFDFSKDKPSNHAVSDLYELGLTRLAGESGGHAKHLLRHSLRLRKRHGSLSTDGTTDGLEGIDETVGEAFRELETARDAAAPQYSAVGVADETREFMEGLQEYEPEIDDQIIAPIGAQ